VLVVDADAGRALDYQQVVRGTSLQVFQARSAADAHQIVHTARPDLIVVNTGLPHDEAWPLLAELRREEATRAVPIIALVAAEPDGDRALALGASRCARQPVDAGWLRQALLEAAARVPTPRILIIDDDEVARYLLRGMLRSHRCVVIEAASGREGLGLAREQKPDLIFCDMLMPEMGGEEVLRALGEDPATRDIPVVVSTARRLTPEERRQLEPWARGILAKDAFAHGDAAAEIRRVLTEARLSP
jgi:CheY-like chemotaxis protein